MQCFKEVAPKITIITPSFNTGKFLKETVESILAQSYENFEHIVVDGGSTDGTIKLLKSYPHIRWISEKDSGYWEAFRKGLRMARGEYVMQCCISDGYLDKEWLGKCVDILEGYPDVSLIWGLQQDMMESGELRDVIYRQFHHVPPPQKTEYFYYWLATFGGWPEGNYCVRRNVFEECFPQFDAAKVKQIDPLIEFNYQFNSRGYLPYFIRTVASFARTHENSLSQKEGKNGVTRAKFNNFLKKAQYYRKNVLLRKTTHCFRDGKGGIIPCEFSVRKFFIEQVFSFCGIRRFTLKGLRHVAQPLFNKVLRSSHASRFVQQELRRLKEYYGERQ